MGTFRNDPRLSNKYLSDILKHIQFLINKPSHRIFNDIILNYFELYGFQLLSYITVLYFPFISFFIPRFMILLHIWDLVQSSLQLCFFVHASLCTACIPSKVINRSLPIPNSPYRGIYDAFAAALLVRSHRHLHRPTGRQPITNREAIRKSHVAHS